MTDKLIGIPRCPSKMASKQLSWISSCRCSLENHNRRQEIQQEPEFVHRRIRHRFGRERHPPSGRALLGNLESRFVFSKAATRIAAIPKSKRDSLDSASCCQYVSVGNPMAVPLKTVLQIEDIPPDFRHLVVT